MMSGRKRGRSYNQDMLVMGMSVLLVFAMYLGTDVARGPTDAFVERHGPHGPDGNGAPGHEVPVLEEVVLVDETGYTAEGTSSEVGFEVPWNATIELTITLEWTDDYGDNDEFELELSLEGQTVDGTSGSAGLLELTQDAPSSGNYTLTITAVDCPGLVGPFPVDRDYGNDWSVKVEAVHEVGP